jgi:hypothetical protein
VPCVDVDDPAHTDLEGEIPDDHRHAPVGSPISSPRWRRWDVLRSANGRRCNPATCRTLSPAASRSAPLRWCPGHPVAHFVDWYRDYGSEQVADDECFLLCMGRCGSTRFIRGASPIDNSPPRITIRRPRGCPALVDRKPNYHLIVREPFQSRKSECLLALFDVHEPTKRYGSKIRAQRRPIRESASTNHGWTCKRNTSTSSR